MSADASGRIDAGGALVEIVRGLVRHARLLPRLAWPAVAVALLIGLTRQYALPAEGAWQAVGLIRLPFDLMLATAWTRMLLLGPDAARMPALGWGRAETDFLFQLIVFALAFLGCVILTVLIVGNLPLQERVLTLVVAAASWVILTLLTPLALKIPARTTGIDLPGRAWQERLANVPNAAAVWLAFLAVSFVLRLIPEQIEGGTDDVFRMTTMVVKVVVDYAILLAFVGAVCALFRQLAAWPQPDRTPHEGSP